VKAGAPLVLWPLMLLGAAFVSFDYFSVVLAAEIWLIVAAAVVMAWGLRRGHVLIRTAAPAFAAILLVLVTRSHYYNGDESPQGLVRQAAAIQRDGYLVETSKMYPACAFYAGARIAVEQDVDAVLEKLNGDAPYYYLTRASILQVFLADGLESKPIVIAGPVASKDFVLIGNQPPSRPSRVTR